MEIRQLDMTHPDEALAAARVEAAAFRENGYYRKIRQQVDDLAAGGQDRLKDPAADDPACRHWGAWIDGCLAAALISIDYTMRFEGKDLPMCGVGGVATLPEFRRRGAVRQIMSRMLRDNCSRGAVFSYLQPFSFAFYSRFGYGHGCRRCRTEIPMASLRELPVSGRTRLYQDQDKASVQAVYSQFISDTNGAVVRSPGMWQRWLGKDPWLDQRYTYIWQDDSGEDRGYVIFTAKREPGGDKLEISDWGCRDQAGLIGILAFLSRFADEYTTVSIALPLYLDVAMLFAEPYPVRQQIEPYGQIRVLDPQQALAALSRPDTVRQMAADMARDNEAGDCLSIMLQDTFLPELSGLYRVQLLQDDAPVQFIPESACAGLLVPDLTVDAGMLATLLLGDRGLAHCLVQKGLTVDHKMDRKRLLMLEQLFTAKKASIYDYF